MDNQNIIENEGWRWITEGFETFMKNPAFWVIMAIIWLVIVYLLHFIPVAGTIIATLIGPALAGGLVYGARELEQGRGLEIPHLFQAFMDQSRLVPMLILGIIPLVTYLALSEIGSRIISSIVTSAMSAGSASGMTFSIYLVGFLISLLMALIICALLLFAIPSVMLDDKDPIAAVQASCRTCLDNLNVYLVFVLALFVCSVLSIWIPYHLTFLIAIPILGGVMYAAYLHVLAGKPAEVAGTQAPVPEPSDDETPPQS